MNTHHAQQSAACGRFASLLPLLDHPDRDDAEANAAREHLRDCASCQARHASYAALDAALRTRYGTASVPRRPTEEIMRSLRERSEETAEPSTTPRHATSVSASPLGGFLRGVGAVACIAALIAVTFALFSSRVHVGPGGKSYTGKPNFTFAGVTGSIASISMVSPREGWALAQTVSTPQGTRSSQEVTLYHYLNGKWFPVYVPISQDFSLGGPNGNGGPGGFNGTISMDSATDGWADVHNFNRVTVLLHYTGGSWHEVPAPSGGIYDVYAISPSSVWAMSKQFALGAGATVVHFNGTSWDFMAGASAGAVAYQMASASHGWALVDEGSTFDNSNRQYAIMRYTGTDWPELATLHTGENTTLTTFSMVSDTEGWVLGQRTVADASGSTTHVPLKQVLYHYLNGHWSEVALPIASGTFTTLESITMLSPDDGWIVGSVQSAYPGATVADFQAHTVLFHYAHGAWTQVQAPDVNAPVDVVQNLAFSADGSTGWAAGYSAEIPASQSVQTDDIPASAVPMLWTFQNGAWSVYRQ